MEFYFAHRWRNHLKSETARGTLYIDICYTYISRNTAFQSKFNIFVVWNINTGIAANGKNVRGTKHDFMGCCVCPSLASRIIIAYLCVYISVKTCKVMTPQDVCQQGCVTRWNLKTPATQCIILSQACHNTTRKSLLTHRAKIFLASTFFRRS